MGQRPRPLPRRRRTGPPELAPAWQQLETERPPTGSLPRAPVLPRPSYGGLSESEFRNEAYRGTARELMANEFNRPPEMYRGERVLGPFLEMTGAPSLVRSYARARDGDPWGSASEAAMGALAIGGVRGAMREPIPAARPAPPMATPWPDDMFGALPREPMPRPPSPEPRLPGRASDGSVLPVAPSRPFTNSLRGGSDDLSEAAGMRSSGALSERTYDFNHADQDFQVRITPSEELGDGGMAVYLARNDGGDPFSVRGDMGTNAVGVFRQTIDAIARDAAKNQAERYLIAGADDPHIRLYGRLARGYQGRDVIPGYTIDPPNRFGGIVLRRNDVAQRAETSWNDLPAMNPNAVAVQHGMSEQQAIDLIARARSGASITGHQQQIIRDMIAADRSGYTEAQTNLQRFLRGDQIQ